MSEAVRCGGGGVCDGYESLRDGNSAGQVAVRVVHGVYARGVAVWRWHGRSAAVVSASITLVLSK